MVMATRNNNAGEEEGSVRDIVLRLQGSIDQLTSKVATIETSYIYLNNEFTRVELTESQAISCFLAGLQQDIGLLVKMFKPKTLYDAYQLARMQETVRYVNTE
nr:retrotransposable element Tf2 [Tanacetum cinerariifolium]